MQEVTTTTVTFPSTSRDVLSGEENGEENGAELLVKRAEDYRWSSYPAHGQGETNELLDRLATYEERRRILPFANRSGAKKYTR